MDKCLMRAFRSNVCVGFVFQLLDILQSAPQGHFLRGAYGLKHESALTLTLKTHFRTACKKFNALRIGRIKGVFLLACLLAAGCSQKDPVEPTVVASQTPPPVYEGTIVAVGDSLTAGLGVPEDLAYPAQLARRLQADGHRYRVVNAGVSGETSSGTLSRIEWVISSLTPDIVILETGANDGLRGLDPNLLQTNLDQLVETLRERHIQVILAGMLMLPNLGPDYTQAFGRIYPRTAEKHGVLFIPFFLEGVAGNAALNQADKLHPTAEGYTRIVETVMPYVVTAIERHKAE